VFLLLAVTIPPVIQSKLDDGVKDFTSINPNAQAQGTEGFRTWSNWADADAQPVFQSVYMYNITNAAEILASPGTKPSLTQHGPYVYQQFKVKFDFVYSTDYDNRQTLSFHEWEYYEFVREQTDPSLDPAVDTYTTMNLPFQAVTSAITMLGAGNDKWPQLEQGFAKYCPGAYTNDMQRMFTSTRTVKELLFGYVDCVTILAALPANGITPANTFPGLLGTNLPPSEGGNQSYVGSLVKRDTVYTGDDDPDYMRQYLEVAESKYLNVDFGVQTILGMQVDIDLAIWGCPTTFAALLNKCNPYPNRVYGTAGVQFKPNLQENSTVNVFVPELSRHAPMVNFDSVHVSDHGIDLLRYTLDPKILTNSSLNWDYYAYAHNGLLNVSMSKQGLPIFMSKPHFLDADVELLAGIDGLTAPVREDHDTWLDVEPLTGATMRANKRLQINLRTSPLNITSTPPFTLYPAVGTHYVPLAWIDENAEISSSKAAQFKSKVYGAQDAIHYVSLLGTILGSIFVGLAVMLLFISVSRTSTEQHRISGGINNQVGY
jgi:lysosome membrane protein 2